MTEPTINRNIVELVSYLNLLVFSALHYLPPFFEIRLFFVTIALRVIFSRHVVVFGGGHGRSFMQIQFLARRLILHNNYVIILSLGRALQFLGHNSTARYYFLISTNHVQGRLTHSFHNSVQFSTAPELIIWPTTTKIIIRRNVHQPETTTAQHEYNIQSIN